MEDPVIIELDGLLSEDGASQKLTPVMNRLLAQLARSPEKPQAWESLPGTFFSSPLPGGVSSCWIFALRGGGKFTSERHPNSWQRSIGIRGSAFFEVYEDGRWQPRPVDPSGGTRTVSIPPNVWHRISIGPETFVSVSFHTARAEELIEETCEGDDFTKTKRRLYHG